MLESINEDSLSSEIMNVSVPLSNLKSAHSFVSFMHTSLLFVKNVYGLRYILTFTTFFTIYMLPEHLFILHALKTIFLHLSSLHRIPGKTLEI